MLERIKRLTNLRTFHPIWMAVPLTAAVVLGGLIWASIQYEVAHNRPAISNVSPPAQPQHLPEPDATQTVASTPASPPGGEITFAPPRREDIPPGPFGDAVRLGRNIFVNTQQYATRYVGNGLNCVNCHLDEGRKADSAPLWAAYIQYPAYRDKNKRVNSYEDRLAGCFSFSMNGKPPPYDSEEMIALVTYSYWLAQGAPTGVELPGRGYPKLPSPAQAPDAQRGAKVFAANCVLCHGASGEGARSNGRYVFPPLWGKDSYNGGAGMSRVETAAAFIRANMPLGKPNSLSVQEAWDIAQFVNAHERPADPRKR